ncbi:MAG: hypothetical protein K2I63_00560, partial [Helicobacter sp.]|nr:hypothetical protein [Helicobacter sp.]
RVNVVGFTQKDAISEDNIYVKPHSLNGNYAVDKNKSIFRVEVYNRENFCGLVGVKHGIEFEEQHERH